MAKFGRVVFCVFSFIILLGSGSNSLAAGSCGFLFIDFASYFKSLNQSQRDELYNHRILWAQYFLKRPITKMSEWGAIEMAHRVGIGEAIGKDKKTPPRKGNWKYEHVREKREILARDFSNEEIRILMDEAVVGVLEDLGMLPDFKNPIAAAQWLNGDRAGSARTRALGKLAKGDVVGASFSNDLSRRYSEEEETSRTRIASAESGYDRSSGYATIPREPPKPMTELVGDISQTGGLLSKVKQLFADKEYHSQYILENIPASHFAKEESTVDVELMNYFIDHSNKKQLEHLIGDALVRDHWFNLDNGSYFKRAAFRYIKEFYGHSIVDLMLANKQSFKIPELVEAVYMSVGMESIAGVRVFHSVVSPHISTAQAAMYLRRRLSPEIPYNEYVMAEVKESFAFKNLYNEEALMREFLARCDRRTLRNIEMHDENRKLRKIAHEVVEATMVQPISNEINTHLAQLKVEVEELKKIPQPVPRKVANEFRDKIKDLVDKVYELYMTLPNNDSTVTAGLKQQIEQTTSELKNTNIERETLFSIKTVNLLDW